MMHVNFLEKKSSALQKIEFNYFWMLIILAGLLLSSFVFDFVQKKRIQYLQEQLTSMTQEIEQLKTKVQATEKEKGVNMHEMDALLNNPISWSDLLSHIADQISPSMQLTQI